MANSLAPFGLQPIRALSGNAIETMKVRMLSGYTTSIYKGQVLCWNGTSKYVIVAANTSAMKKGNMIAVAAEFYKGSSAATKTALQAWPITRHDFVAQADGASTVSNAQTYIFQCIGASTRAGYSATAGSTISGWSGMAVRTASVATAATCTAPFRVMDVYRQIGSSSTGAYMKLIVRGVPDWCIELTNAAIA